ncbi:MAG: DNA repair protein RecN [Rikenellaceae bacterium]|nr:DNA repair protein RecN [Rikenellaceae bacterium]
MLRTLTVENYVLIDRLEMELDRSLNIITGQTGAGKSILLGALGLLLGNKAEGGAMRDESRNCVIEGQFDVEGYGLESFFDENDLDYDPSLTIRRVITPAGKSRSYVNDLPVGQSVLRELGVRLVDIHSQHRNLILSDDKFRIGVVDSIAGCGAQVGEYRKAYDELQAAERELAQLRAEAERNRRDEEWIRFQVEELTAANLREGELARIEAEQSVLANADAIGEAIVASRNALDDEQVGVLLQLKTIEQAMSGVAATYAPAGELFERVHSALLDLKDVSSELASAAEHVDADPERLSQVVSRIDLIYSLQQKHRVTSEAELIALREKYTAQLQTITSGDERIAALERHIGELRTEALRRADEIHELRTKAVPAIDAELSATLSELGMPSARFTVDVAAQEELMPTGRDRVSFLFTANMGLAPQPVEKIASGGEISRVMLALKALVARSMQLPTIIFDEIDTGVSGQIADAMGRIISNLSRSMQVINITHLPQVASKGKTHFVVYKEDTLLGAMTSIRQLSARERVDEIAKMLSGSTVTAAAVEQAKCLLDAK